MATRSIFTAILLVSCTRQCDTPNDEIVRHLDDAIVIHLADALPRSQLLAPQSAIEFGKPEYRPYLRSGWSGDHSSGKSTWSWVEGRSALLELWLPETVRGKQTRLTFSGRPFVFPNSEPQTVEVTLNGEPIASLTLTDEHEIYDLPIGAGIARVGRNELQFEFSRATAPVTVIPGSHDARELSMVFFRLSLTPTGAPPREHKWQAERRGRDILHPAATGLVFHLTPPTGAQLHFALDRRVNPIVLARSRATGREVAIPVSRTPDSSECRANLAAVSNNEIELVLSAYSDVPLTDIAWVNPRIIGQRSDLQFDQTTNLLFVVIDTLRADHLSSYGGALATPNLDSLVARGLMFRTAYAHIPITGPSHATMFTSSLPSNHGVLNNAQVLHKELTTLADVLHGAGRDTGAVVSLNVLAESWGFGQGFDHYDDEFTPKRFWRTAQEVNARAIPWLTQDRDRPFFAWLHYSDPHEPYVPPKTELEPIEVVLNGMALGTMLPNGEMHAFEAMLQPGANRVALRGDFGDRQIRMRAVSTRPSVESLSFERLAPGFDTRIPANFTAAYAGEKRTVQLRLSCTEVLSIAEIKLRYAAEVASVDCAFGELLAALDDSDLRNNTLIVLTSDHGEGLGDHDHIGHIDQLYDSLTRVPLVLAGPDVPHGVVDVPVRHLDLAPTMLDLLGIPIPSTMKGLTLLPLVSTPESRVVPLMTYRPEARHDLRGIRMVNQKLIVNDRAKTSELYELGRDPGELRPLTTQDPAMRSALGEHVPARDSADHARETNVPLTDEERDQLRALGYVH